MHRISLAVYTIYSLSSLIFEIDLTAHPIFSKNNFLIVNIMLYSISKLMLTFKFNVIIVLAIFVIEVNFNSIQGLFEQV